MQLTTQGLVLREVNYKESDKILTVLTQDMGKLTISARGSRKKGGGISAAAQMLVWSEMTLYEYRQRWSLKEAVTNREFRGVREDLESYALACYFAEIIDQLAPGTATGAGAAGAHPERPLRPGKPGSSTGAHQGRLRAAGHVPGRL